MLSLFLAEPQRLYAGTALMDRVPTVWKTWKFEQTFSSQGKVRENDNFSQFLEIVREKDSQTKVGTVAPCHVHAVFICVEDLV